MIVMCSSIAYANNPATKLLRGTTNLLTGWVEIPKNIYDRTVEEDLFKGVTIGAVSGFGMAVVRTGTGLYEVMTFPIPLPEGYGPILEPEYVFSE